MTIIDYDFIKNETLIRLKQEPKEQEIIFKEYYYFICDFINDYHYLKPSYAELEKYVNDGFLQGNVLILIARLKTKKHECILLSECKPNN